MRGPGSIPERPHILSLVLCPQYVFFRLDSESNIDQCNSFVYFYSPGVGLLSEICEMNDR